MVHTILHAKEYGLDLPSSIPSNCRIIPAHTNEEAIGIINEQKEYLEGYILGMMMIKDGASVQQVNDAYRAKHDFLPSVNWKGKTDQDLEDQFRARKLEENYHALLDNEGGRRVYAHLVMRCELGKKPLLFYTSLERRNHPVVRTDPQMKLGLANVPAESREILGWFEKNFR